MGRTVARVLEEKDGGDIFGTSPGATVYEALEMMADHNVGALIVLDEGRLVGIMSERDYARKIILLNRLSRDTRVSEIMTDEVLTVTPDQTIDVCMAMMTDQRIRHLPVLVDDEVVGVVSIGDVVRAVIEEQQFLIQQLESYIAS